MIRSFPHCVNEEGAKSIDIWGGAIVFWTELGMKGNPGKCLHGSISILPTETFPLLAVWAPGLWQGSLISCPVQHMVLLSVVKVQIFTEKLQSLREGMEAFSLSFPFLPCSWSLMQSASTSRVFTIYTVHYLTVQGYFHCWDWQAASCQDRTGVFFSIRLNELSFFGLNTLTLD